MMMSTEIVTPVSNPTVALPLRVTCNWLTVIEEVVVPFPPTICSFTITVPFNGTVTGMAPIINERFALTTAMEKFGVTLAATLFPATTKFVRTPLPVLVAVEPLELLEAFDWIVVAVIRLLRIFKPFTVDVLFTCPVVGVSVPVDELLITPVDKTVIGGTATPALKTELETEPPLGGSVTGAAPGTLSTVVTGTPRAVIVTDPLTIAPLAPPLNTPAALEEKVNGIMTRKIVNAQTAALCHNVGLIHRETRRR